MSKWRAFAFCSLCCLLCLVTQVGSPFCLSTCRQSALAGEVTPSSSDGTGGELSGRAEDEGDNTELKLNGQGTRNVYKRIIIRDVAFKVYNAALYVPQPTTDAHKIIYDYPSVELRISFLRSVSASNFRKSAARCFRALLEKDGTYDSNIQSVDHFLTLFGERSFEKGDRLSLRFSTDGVQVSRNDKFEGQVEGRTFQQLARRIWLDDAPWDRGLQELRQSLLTYKPTAEAASASTLTSTVGQ